MNARRLIALYPRKWRERYGEEFDALVGQHVDWRTAMDILKSALAERGHQTEISALGRIAKLLAASAAIVLMLVWFVTAFEIVTFAHRAPTLGDFARATAGAIGNQGFQRMLAGLFVVPMLFSILLAVLVGGFRWTRSRPRLCQSVVRFGAAGVYASFVLAAMSFQRILHVPLPLLGAALFFMLIGFAAEWALLRGRADHSEPSSMQGLGAEQ